MKKYTLINNNIIEKNSTSISTDDRAFRFGDSTFQSIKVYEGSLYDLDIYINRLINSSKTLKFNFKPNITEIKKNLHDLVIMNNIKNGTLRINLSRGSKSMGYLPANNTDICLVANCYNTPPNNTKNDVIGISDITLWDMPLDFAAVKNSRSINYIMAKISAHEKGHYDDIILTKEGLIAECSSSNIFWIKDSTIYTPDIKCGIYPGHIRSKIINSDNFNIKFSEAKTQDIIDSEEIFLTNSNLLVKSIKNLKIGDDNYEKNSLISQEISSYLKQDLHLYHKNHG